VVLLTGSDPYCEALIQPNQHGAGARADAAVQSIHGARTDQKRSTLQLCQQPPHHACPQRNKQRATLHESCGDCACRVSSNQPTRLAWETGARADAALESICGARADQRGPRFDCANSHHTTHAFSAARNAPASLQALLTECDAGCKTLIQPNQQELVHELMLQCKTYMVQGRTRRGPSFSCANSYYTMRARNTTRNAPVTLLAWLTECKTTASPLP
jgi:hypothetical protein